MSKGVTSISLKSLISIASISTLLLAVGYRNQNTMSSSNVVLYDLPSRGGFSWSLNPWKSECIRNNNAISAKLTELQLV